MMLNTFKTLSIDLSGNIYTRKNSPASGYQFKVNNRNTENVKIIHNHKYDNATIIDRCTKILVK